MAETAEEAEEAATCIALDSSTPKEGASGLWRDVVRAANCQTSPFLHEHQVKLEKSARFDVRKLAQH
jgi:hypothetical protein